MKGAVSLWSMGALRSFSVPRGKGEMGDKACYGRLRADVLVIGGGGAGTRAAIEAARCAPELQIFLVNRGLIGRSGLTSMANGGIHWVEHPEDSFDAHFNDVVRMGYYLNDQNLVEVLVQEAPIRGRELVAWGARMLMDGDKPLLLDPKGSGCSYPRAHVIPGNTFMRTLYRKAKGYRNIRFLEDFLVTRLFVKGDEVAGAFLLDMREGAYYVVEAKAVVLATGGLGEIYLHTTNSPFGLRGYASGIGYALALRAGCELIDMEMIQFTGHQLYPPWPLGNPALLSSLCGGKYVNALGEEFLKLPQPRDVIQKLAYKEIREGRGTPRGGVFIDLSLSPLSSEEIVERLKISLGGKLAKSRWKLIEKMSVKDPDPKNWKVEFTPGGAHFCMGGVRINENCETNIKGLFAAGEVTGGLHGANRMGGNALSEVLVFGARAGANAAREARRRPYGEVRKEEILDELRKLEQMLREKYDPPGVVIHELRKTMDTHVNVVRHKDGLKEALNTIRSLKDYLPRIGAPKCRRFNQVWIEAIECGFMLDVCEVVIQSALFRTESRGAHFREDFPEESGDWLRHVCVREEKGAIRIYTVPVRFTRTKPPSFHGRTDG